MIGISGRSNCQPPSPKSQVLSPKPSRQSQQGAALGARTEPTFIERPLQGGHEAPVPGPRLSAVLDGEALALGPLGPEGEVEQVHGEDEGGGTVPAVAVVGLGMQLVSRPGGGGVGPLAHLRVDDGGGVLARPHVEGDVHGVVVDVLGALEDARLRLGGGGGRAHQVRPEEGDELGAFCPGEVSTYRTADSNGTSWSVRVSCFGL